MVGEGEGEGKVRKGVWQVIKDVMSERGVRGFFRGGLFRLVWIVLGSGLYLGMYDVVRMWFK